MTASLTRSATNSRPAVGAAAAAATAATVAAATATATAAATAATATAATTAAHPHRAAAHHHHLHHLHDEHPHMFSTTPDLYTNSSAPYSIRSSHPAKRPLVDPDSSDSRPVKRSRLLQVVSRPPPPHRHHTPPPPPPPPPPLLPPATDNGAPTAKYAASPLAPPTQPPLPPRQAHTLDHASRPSSTASSPSLYTAYRFSTSNLIMPTPSSANQPSKRIPTFSHDPPAQPSPPPPPPPPPPQIASSSEPVLVRVSHNNKKLRANASRSPAAAVTPTTAASQSTDQGRKLRSQEASRFKSDLSTYFPDYDEIIGNEIKEKNTLTFDTPIIIHDSAAAGSSPLISLGDVSIRRYHGDLYSNLNAAHHVDLSALEAHYKHAPAVQDPLPDAFFKPIHCKAERVEKHIRNTERGRAHHERAQVARLLDELQGHDWLRTMGVSGITTSQKRKYEPAREYFIGGCEAIIDKFKQWTREEKRRKAEKDRALAERAAADEDQTDDDDDDDDDDESAPETAPRRRGKAKTARADSPIKITLRITSDSSPGKRGRRRKASRITIHREEDDYDDDEQEAEERGQIENYHSGQPAAQSEPPPPPPPPEITSFFKKKYERDLWLNRQRPPGRMVMAWGVLMPNITKREFVLDQDVLDQETIKMRDKARREKRGKH